MAGKLTIYEFARAIGVSTSTVSRAINNSKDISPKTRERVLAKMTELGFRPNPLASTLASGRSQTIALWCPGLRSPYASTVIAALEAEVESHDFDLVVVDVERRRNDPDKLASAARFPAEGVLVLDGRPWLGRLVATRALPPLPIVSMGTLCDPSVDCVSLDLYEGMLETVRHLAAQGCRRIAFLGHVGSRDEAGPRSRNAAYETAIAGLGLETEFITAGHDQRHIVTEHVINYVRKRGCPEAIVSYNDELAIAAYRGLREMGFRVPEDVLLAGCDGIEEGEYVVPPLTTVALPFEEMCAAAWDLLEQRLADPDRPRQTLTLNGRLTVRGASRRRG